MSASQGSNYCQRISLGVRQGAPLDLQPDDIDNLVRQTRYVLVAEVDGNAGMLLLQFAGSIWAALADVLAGVVEGGLCEGDDLLVRNGHGRVVAHDERRSERRTAANKCADMLMQRWGASAATANAAIVNEAKSYRVPALVEQAPPAVFCGWRS